MSLLSRQRVPCLSFLFLTGLYVVVVLHDSSADRLASTRKGSSFELDFGDHNAYRLVSIVGRLSDAERLTVTMSVDSHS